MNKYGENMGTSGMSSSTGNLSSDQSRINEIKRQNQESAQNAGKAGMTGSNQSFTSSAVSSDQNRINEIKKQNQESAQNAAKNGSGQSFS